MFRPNYAIGRLQSDSESSHSKGWSVSSFAPILFNVGFFWMSRNMPFMTDGADALFADFGREHRAEAVPPEPDGFRGRYRSRARQAGLRRCEVTAGI